MRIRRSRRLTLLSLTILLLNTASADDDLARELPRVRPLDARKALESFRLNGDFTLLPVATEPLVTDPVSACYDEDGRLYVVEMRGYPYPENTPTGYVRRLEDVDGDGTFDRSTIFLAGLSWPTSVVASKGGVFIAVAPEILYAKDTDGDGKADVREVVFSGFGTQNVQGLVNGLLWGPVGWIYGVSGGNGGDITNHRRPGSRPVSVRGRDFRFRPDGSSFEAVSGGGQFGHSFDDWGHRFTCNNSNHIRQVVLPADALDRNPAFLAPAVVDDIAAEGPAAPVYRISPAEPWRVVRTRQRAADPEYRRRLPPTELVATGFFTSATGVTIYRGDAFAPEYRGNAFIGDVGGNLVHRKIITQNGAEFLATRADADVEFLASTDNWFRPVNFTNTPDGTLLILDMYRETIEHPLSIPEPIKKHLDLTSGKDLGRLYELVPKSGHSHRVPRLSKATTDELVAHLADGAAWSRETAQRLIIERNDPASTALLEKLARDRPTPLARMHALWTLGALSKLTASHLETPLKDPDPRVREQSVKLADPLLKSNTTLARMVYPLADDPDPMVRFQTALALGGLPGTDPNAVVALAKIAARDASDRWTRAAVLASASHRVGAILERLAEVDRPLFDRPEGRTLIGEFTSVLGGEKDAAATRAVLDRFSAPGTDPALTRAVVLGLGQGLQRVGSSLRGLAGPSLDTVFQRAQEVATAEGPEGPRVDAIRLLSLGPIGDALKTLPDRLDAREPIAVQLAAIQGLGEIPDARVGTLILTHWKALSPAVRREAVESLFARPDRLSALLDALDAKDVAPSDLDPVRQKQLLTHADANVRSRAERALADASKADRKAVIDSYRKALTLEGDPSRGRNVHIKACATCHRAGDQGNDVGPNLATVSGRTPEDLLIHILDPNREVAPGSVNYSIETIDGRIFTGLIAEESATAVTLKRAEGASDIIPRPRIASIASTGLSLMPDGLEKGLTPQDMADLIAFLRSIPPASR